jgi:uncharacterized surface anchored protein
LEIAKKSSVTGEPLANAVFALYDGETDARLADLTTDASGKASYPLPPGSFYLVETSAPEGFVLNGDPIEFTVTSGQATVVTIQNTPVPPKTGNIRIVNMIEGTTMPLEGGVFGVFNAENDEQVETLTAGGDGTATGAALPPGAYYIRQITAPQGYDPITANIAVTVTAGGTAEVYLYNTPTPKDGRIKLTKLVEGTNEPLAGAVFGIYDASTHAKVAEITSGADGTAVSGELPPGTYYLMEIQIPEGYKVVTDKTGVTIVDGETVELTVYNALLPGFVKIVKLEAETEKPLPNVVFGLYDAASDAKVAELTTGADGTVTSGELPRGEYYLLETQGLPGYEAMTDRIPVTVKAGQTATATVHNTPVATSPGNGYIQLTQKAEGTGARLPDAVYGLYAAESDAKVEELITGANGEAFSEELPQGDYYLLEQQAPQGFMALTQKIGVTVQGGETTEKTVYNAPMTGYVRVVKQAEGTGALLPGAIFAIHDAAANGKVGEMTTGADGRAVSEDLPEGDYYLIETKAPAGYAVKTDRIPFSIAVGEATELTVTNALAGASAAANSYVRILKLAEGTDALLSGAVFGLFRQGTDEKISEYTTGADGTATGAAVTAGDYYVLELTAPNGYKLSADKITFSLKANETAEVKVYNAPIDKEAVPTGNLHLTKKAGITGKPLYGAVFGVYDAATDTRVSEITSGADGTAVCALPEGNYYLIEEKAPVGYVTEHDRIPFTITADGTVSVEVTNMAADGGVRLIVRDADGTALPGAVFGVYNALGEKITELTTGSDGTALGGLASGDYYMLEQTPPTGYLTDSSRYSFTVTEGQTVDVLVIKQSDEKPPTPTFEIPKTGIAYPWLNYVIAALLLCAAVLMSVNLKGSNRRK